MDIANVNQGAGLQGCNGREHGSDFSHVLSNLLETGAIIVHVARLA